MDILYAYEPIPTSRRMIRIATLHPDRDTKTALHLSIGPAALDETPQYSSLSYVWGSGEKTHSIILNGNRFLVNKNLYTALWHIHGKLCAKEPLRIWIDALCINQSDIR